jgi:hypothetical protein
MSLLSGAEESAWVWLVSHRPVYDHAVTIHRGTRLDLQAVRFISYEIFSTHALSHFTRFSSNYIKSLEVSLFIDSSVEAGSNASTVALRVVRGDGKGIQWVGVYLGHPVTGRYIYWNLVLPRESDLRMTVLARASSNCKLQTRPLVREGVI